jgi:hypothetical protein
MEESSSKIEAPVTSTFNPDHQGYIKHVGEVISVWFKKIQSTRIFGVS